MSALPGSDISLSVVSSAIDLSKASKALDGLVYTSDVKLDVKLR